MKRSILVLVTLMVLNTASTAFGTTIRTVAAVGEFLYPARDSSLLVWEDTTCGLSTSFCGQLDGKGTKITIRNRSVSAKDLDLLTGERVLAIGTMRVEGVGERSKQYWTKLDIYLLPRTVLGSKVFAGVGILLYDGSTQEVCVRASTADDAAYLVQPATIDRYSHIVLHNNSLLHIGALAGRRVAVYATVTGGDGEGSHYKATQIVVWDLLPDYVVP